MRVWCICTGISFDPSASDRPRGPRRSTSGEPKPCFFRQEIGTVEIMRRTGRAKICVWRWQASPRKASRPVARQDAAVADPLFSEVAERVVPLTLEAPPGPGDALDDGDDGRVGISASSVQRIWRAWPRPASSRATFGQQAVRPGRAITSSDVAGVPSLASLPPTHRAY